MAGALTQKPQAASAAFGVPAGMFGMAVLRPKPVPLQRDVPGMSARLLPADPLQWTPACRQRDFATHLMQPKLEMRGFVRSAPALNVTLSVVGLPTSQFNLPASREMLPVPVVAATAAREAVVWVAPPRDLGSLIVLSEWAAQSLPFLALPLLDDESDPAEAEVVSPAQESSRGPAHIPESGAVPLRPTIIAGGGPVAGNATEPAQAEKLRKPAVTILAPERPVAEPVRAAEPTQLAPEQQDAAPGPVRVPLTQPVPQLDLGLPQLRNTSGGSIPLRLRKLFSGSKET